MSRPQGIGNLQHAADIMRAALPHLNTQSKRPIELVLKTSELLDAIANPDSGELSACALDKEPIDLEAMLLHVQEVCNEQEKEQVNLILNFVKARKLYQTYQSFRINNPGFQGDNPGSGPFSSGGFPSMMDFFTSQMSPEQKSSFDNISMILNAMNTQA